LTENLPPFLFYNKDIKHEIVHTLLLEEYGVSKKWVIIMDERQDKTAASTQAERSASLAQDCYCAMRVAQEEARRNSVETETNKDESSSCDVVLTCDDVRFFLITCFGIELVLCDLYLTRFDLTKDFLFDVFFIDVFNK